MDTQILIIVIGVIAAILVVIGVWYFTRQARSKKLRERFGPEYHQTVRKLKSREVAEAELREREKRVSQFSIVPLPPVERARYQQNWTTLQSRFVDEPETAVSEANRLVREVMEKRGYPVTTFQQSAADLSVNHPGVVENYRAAHSIAERCQTGDADTEELRKAIVYYRALFHDLLGNGEPMADRTTHQSTEDSARANKRRSFLWNRTKIES